ncbi:DUF6292 family protein [Streptomyces sp. NPDC002133]|uniref:DUF6292 family protein n=1 Tax=Streptomyces sp. NPDC002133 TaxID=3154409 RepID=UPI00332E3C81
MSDLPLPHREYIDAVVAVLGDLAGGEVTVEYDGRGMGALIALADEEYDEEELRTLRTVLHWSTVNGWTYGYSGPDANGSDLEQLLTALVPHPAEVADAARHASQVLTEQLPLHAAETPTHNRPLPAHLAAAVETGGLPPSLAAQLALYTPA